jgi:hypothetical protein
VSRTKSRGPHNRDLWKPGALSGIAHSAHNKRLARRIERKRAKRALAREEGACR